MVLNFGVFCPVSNSPTWTLCYVMRPSLARKARGRQWGLSRDIWRRLKCEIETYTSSFLPSTVYRPHRWFYHERRESVRWEISACVSAGNVTHNHVSVLTRRHQWIERRHEASQQAGGGGSIILLLKAMRVRLWAACYDARRAQFIRWRRRKTASRLH